MSVHEGPDGPWYFDEESNPHLVELGEGYADGDEISTSRLALLTDTGTICSECGAQFTEAHGCVTACTYCWKRLTAEERAAVNRASHPEVNKEAHRAEAKARKQKRKA